MPQFFIVLFKINMVLGFLACLYFLVFQKLTFYSLNRWFLLFALFFSLTYPLIDLGFFITHQPDIPFVSIAPEMRMELENLVSENANPVFFPWVYALVLSGIAIMSVRLLAQFFSLYKEHKRSEAAMVGNINVRLINASVGPFSFGNHIYLNLSAVDSGALPTIVAHEYVHVRQRHSFDIVVSELITCLCWFNPAAWLVRKAIRENLEFIADREILNAGADKKSYQRSLLSSTILANKIAITTDFNLIDLRKRIKMMNRRSSSMRELCRYVLTIPFVLAVCLAFALPENRIVKSITTVLNSTNTASPVAISPADKSTDLIDRPANITSRGSKRMMVSVNDQSRLASRSEEISSFKDESDRRLQPKNIKQSAVVFNSRPATLDLVDRIEEGFSGGLNGLKKAKSSATEQNGSVRTVKGEKLPESSGPQETVVVGYRSPRASSTNTLNEKVVIGRPRQVPQDSTIRR